MTDTCVCCGEYVAEGKQVCNTCQLELGLTPENVRKVRMVPIKMEEGMFATIERVLDEYDEIFELTVQDIVDALEKGSRTYGEALKNLRKFKNGFSFDVKGKYENLFDAVANKMRIEMYNTRIQKEGAETGKKCH